MRQGGRPTIVDLDQHLLIRSRVSAVTVAFAGVRTAGRAHSARPQPSPRVRRRTPALLSESLSIDQAPTGEHDRPMAPSIEGMRGRRGAENLRLQQRIAIASKLVRGPGWCRWR
jgi:hypothetical protein